MTELAEAHPGLDDLQIASGRRVERTVTGGSESPGFELAARHSQVYVPTDGATIDQVAADVRAAVLDAGFVLSGSADECYEGPGLDGSVDSARITEVGASATVLERHVLLRLGRNERC